MSYWRERSELNPQGAINARRFSRAVPSPVGLLSLYQFVMEVPVGFEPTSLSKRICSPPHSTTLPQHPINLEPMEELESPTFSFVGSCSNPLSYTGIIFGSDHWNRTSPILPYEGSAQTIYARSPLFFSTTSSSI